MPRDDAAANRAPLGGAGPEQGWAGDWALPLGLAAACFALVLGAGALAGALPARFLGNWAPHVVAHQAAFLDRFFPFDAQWYQRIADDGYQWDPRLAGVKQDVAFFPLWPLLLRAVAWVMPGRLGAVVMAAGFGAASIGAFHHLARRVLRQADAGWATALFALYPGASFLLDSYPTGLMNLLVAGALLAVLDGRFWLAAVCAGLVTGIGPLGLGTALTVFLYAALAAWRAREPGVRALARLAALGAVSVAGLAGFLGWQMLAFGDALAFVKAQEAWAISRPWPQRIPRFAVQALVVPELVAALRALAQALRLRALVPVQEALNTGLNLAAQAVGLAGVYASLPGFGGPVAAQGVFTMALFIWFHSVSRPGNSTFRLTYCIVGMFMGVAWLIRGRRRVQMAAVAISAMMLAGASFLVNAGYHVV